MKFLRIELVSQASSIPVPTLVIEGLAVLPAFLPTAGLFESRERDITISLDVAIQCGGSNVIGRWVAIQEQFITASMIDTRHT